MGLPSSRHAYPGTVHRRGAAACGSNLQAQVGWGEVLTAHEGAAMASPQPRGPWPSLTKGQSGGLDAQIDDPDFQVFQGFCRCFFDGGSLGLMLVCGSSGWPLVLRG